MSMAKTSFDETLALSLYHDHKTDTEIAKGVGSLTITIRSWRKRRGLKNISPSARPNAKYPKPEANKPKEYGGVDYRTALGSAQAKEMGKFLRTLLRAADKAKAVGVKPNIDIFMRAWIGLPVSAEEKRQQNRNNQVDYVKRKAGVRCS